MRRSKAQLVSHLEGLGTSKISTETAYIFGPLVTIFVTSCDAFLNAEGALSLDDTINH